tara:strand:- start:743 stop:844 length:102 start_codon:yes stop_codon:yes gene_type:complete
VREEKCVDVKIVSAKNFAVARAAAELDNKERLI